MSNPARWTRKPKPKCILRRARFAPRVVTRSPPAAMTTNRKAHWATWAPGDGRLTMMMLGRCGGSAPGQWVLQTALRIELVPAARQFQRAEIFVVVLAVIAYGLNDPIGPLIVDTKDFP